MFALDLRTQLLSFMLCNLVCLALVVSLWRNNRQRYAGTQDWLANFVLQFLGLLLLLARGQVPNFFSIVVANAMLVGGTYLLHRGLLKFLNRPHQPWPGRLVWLAFVLVHTYFSEVENNAHIRNINISIALAFFGAQMSYLLLRQTPAAQRPIVVTTGWTALSYTVFSLLRLVLELLYPVTPTNAFGSPQAAFIVLGYQLLTIAITITLSLMVNRALIANLNEQLVAKDHTTRALQESEAHFKLAEFLGDQALELAQAGPWSIDFSEGDTHYRSSARSIAIFGDPATDDMRYSLGHWYRCIAAADTEAAANTLDNFRAALSGQIPRFDAEHPYQRPSDGTIVWVHVMGHVLRDGAGRPTHVYGVVMDITERRSMDERLRQSRNQLHHILDASPVAVRILSLASNTIAYANQSYCNLTGQAMDRVIGLDPQGAYFDAARYQDILQQAKSGQTLTNLLMQARRSGDHLCMSDEVASGTMWLRASFAPLHYQDEACVIAWLYDISDLMLARDAAEEANRSKSAFLANMSHEIRTPLNAIVGMAYILRTTALTPSQLQSVVTMESASNHLIQIINDVLDLSKIEAGKITLESRAFKLDVLMNNMTTMLMDRAKAKGITLHLDLDLQDMTYQGDPTRLQQLLLNYGSNAIKFSNDCAVHFRVHTQHEQDNTVLLRFEVCDRGIGIAAEKLERLFSAFEQADVSTTRKYGGTGLGLAISKHIATLMGGAVGVSSVPGEGSTFWFTVQLERIADDTELDPESWRESLKEQLKSNFAGTSVLVADDEPVNLEIATFLLEEVGFRVIQADDGQQALETARIQQFDMVILDMQMPQRDGLSTCRELRKMERYAGTPIIAMTGNIFKEDRERCTAAGMTAFVPKPIEHLDFYQVLWEACTEQVSV